MWVGKIQKDVMNIPKYRGRMELVCKWNCFAIEILKINL